jgi:hypothetical protein
MKNGDKAILVPGASKVKRSSSSSLNSRVAQTLRAMTEQVTIIELDNNRTGNAFVRDHRGTQFFCNVNDLSESYPDYF